MEKNTDLYKELGVNPDATDEEIKRAWRSLCSIYHPDKWPEPENRAEAAERMADINRAYEILSNPETRAKYDAGLLDPAPDPYMAIYDMAVGYFDNVVSSAPMSAIDNIFNFIDMCIDSDKASAQANIKKAEADIKRMSKLVSRINCDGRVNNVFADVMNHRIVKSKDYIEKAHTRLTHLDLCRQFIKHFSDLGYIPDPPEATAHTTRITLDNTYFRNHPGNGITLG